MILNHLWQSTAFLTVAALLAFALRRHRAAIRYRVWMAASLKFLVPFSVLTSLGERISWRTVPVPGTFHRFLEQTTEPFSPHLPPFTQPQPQAISFTAVLATAWFLGFTFVLLRWTARWIGIRSAARGAEPLRRGGIDLLCASQCIEPGVFGIFRPVILLPAAIFHRLSPGQLDAVIAHELSHVRRRDNLTAALHMLVEAAFWFHPVVWWLGARLVAERELASDEDVVRAGASRQSYAAALLQVCRFCLEAPLPCAAGIAGSNLNTRIERIMLHTSIRPLERAGKLLLSVAAVAAFALPFAFGAFTAHPVYGQQPAGSALATAFEAASVKLANPAARGAGLVVDPGRLRLINLTLQQCIGAAWNFADFRISAPSDLPPGRYDITATAPGHTSREFDRPLQLMLQRLLTERFHIAVHREQKVLSHYALLQSKTGPKLKPSDQPGYSTRSGAGSLHAWGLNMDEFADYLTRHLDRPVVDATGISGRYDLTLTWSPDETQSNPELPNPNQTPSAADETRPSIFKALEEQLGLKLEGRKGPVEILSIDHVEKLAEN